MDDSQDAMKREFEAELKSLPPVDCGPVSFSQNKLCPVMILILTSMLRSAGVGLREPCWTLYHGCSQPGPDFLACKGPQPPFQAVNIYSSIQALKPAWLLMKISRPQGLKIRHMSLLPWLLS